MKPFEYLRPKTIAETVAAAAEPGAAYLAGGTNLLDLMKGGVSRPDPPRQPPPRRGERGRGGPRRAGARGRVPHPR